MASPMSLHEGPTPDYLDGMSQYVYHDQQPRSYNHGDVVYVEKCPDQTVEPCFLTTRDRSPEDLSFISPSFPHHSSTHSYSTSHMDDCFSDTTGHMDPHEASSPEAPSIEHGNKMLSFQFPSYRYTILDAARCQTSLSLTAQLHGMFFLAESSRAGSGDSMVPPVELTCYRRNLFQITGCITFPQMMRYVLTEHGEPIPILSQELCISATESVEGNPIKIISVPWKTPAAGAPPNPEEKTEKEPSSIPITKVSDQYSDSDYFKFPIEWKRLQFRVATANNGRRKELQQHFIIKLSVVATLANGAKASVCEALSGPIIVRGRSPRNFQQRRDFPLSGTGGSMRKAMQSNSRPRTSSPDSITHRASSKSRTSPVVSNNFSRHQSPEVHGSNFDWTSNPNGTSGISSQSVTRTSRAPDMLDYAMSSPEMSQRRKPELKRKAVTPEPQSTVSYSSYDDFCGSAPLDRPRKTPRIRTANSSPHENIFLPFAGDYGNNTNLSSLLSSGADMSGKYSAAGIEDWMPPVDPIYKPEGFQYMTGPAMMTVGMGRMGRHKRVMSDGFI